MDVEDNLDDKDNLDDDQIKLQPLSLFLCPCKETPLGPTVEVHFLIAPLQTLI